MATRYFRITEIMKLCDVSEEFVRALEREDLIAPKTRKQGKVYPVNQADRIRVAQILTNEMGVNLEGVEIVLHMRDQIIGMRRHIANLMAELAAERKSK